MATIVYRWHLACAAGQSRRQDRQRLVLGMKLIFVWVANAAILLCTISQAAQAQAPSPGSPADAASRLNQEIALLAGKQYILVGPKVGGALTSGQRKSITVQLASGVSNAIVGSCGGNCNQVEIALFDYQHILVTRNNANGNVAVKIGRPKYSGLYQVEIAVPGCRASACDVAFAVLQQQGPQPNTAADARSRLDRSAQFLKDQDYAATTDPVFAKIPAGQSKSFPVTLTSAAVNALVTTCGSDCDHVQVSLYDYQHALVAQSTEKEAIVYKFGKPPYEGLYQVAIAVPGCRAAECDVGLLVLRQKPADPCGRPDGKAPLSEADRITEIKCRLYALNFDPGGLDESAVDETLKQAIREFEVASKLAQTGEPTAGLLQRLRAATPATVWGTIMYDKAQRWGMTWAEPSRGESVEQAQKSCGDECGVEVSFFGTQCAAFAHSETGWSIQTRDKVEWAKEAAISACEKRGTHCRIIAAVCADGSERISAGK